MENPEALKAEKNAKSPDAVQQNLPLKRQPQSSIIPIETSSSFIDAPEPEANDQPRPEFDVESAGVKDRWSRYIGAMGVDAVRRQTTSSVLISGMGGLGAEIAKNVVLSGVKRLTLHDPALTKVKKNEIYFPVFMHSGAGSRLPILFARD